jgi:hypothetical protein
MRTRIVNALAALATVAIMLSATTVFATEPSAVQRVTAQVATELAPTTLGFWHHHGYGSYGCCGGYGYGGYGYGGYGYGYVRPSLYYNAAGACCGGGYVNYRPYAYRGYAMPAYYTPYGYSGYARPPYYQPYHYTARPIDTTGYYAPYGDGVYGMPYSAYYRPYYTYPRAYYAYGYASYPSDRAFAYPYAYGGAAYYGF